MFKVVATSKNGFKINKVDNKITTYTPNVLPTLEHRDTHC